MAFDWTSGAISAGLNAGLNQGYSSSQQTSAQSANSNGYSNTNASEAREWSAQQAEIAFEREKELMHEQMAFNAQQAEIARKWNESMANTVYTRSVNNMREAGINPILAANMGLSGSSVGSAQTASIAGHGAPMAQGYMDSSSAWQSASQGSSQGSSQSEQGIVTALSALGKMFGEGLNAVNSALNLNISIDGLKQAAKEISTTEGNDSNKDGKFDITDSIKNTDQSFGNWLLHELNPFNSPLLADLRKKGDLAKEYPKNYNIFENN